MAKSRNATDKDMLFSKLLPALNDNPFSAPPEREDDALALSTGRMAPPPPIEEDQLSALHNKLFSRYGIASSDTLSTFNVMEDMVLRYVDAVMDKFNLCKCDRCRCDVAAYALNHLPPKYMVADPQRMAQVESELELRQVMAALVKASIQIRNFPRH